MRGFLSFVAILNCFVFYSCSGENSAESGNVLSEKEKRYYPGTGVGPITDFQLASTIDLSMAKQGEKLFNAKCISCHVWSEERRIGPGLEGVTKRRRPEWILNQMLNPLEMTKKDSLAKELLSIYLAQMTPMNLTQEEAIAILEYLRKKDSE